MMNPQPKSPPDTLLTPLLLRGGLALLILVVLFIATAQGQSQPANSVSSSPIHVTHVLGFEDVRRNASGELSIDSENLRFQRDKTPAAQVSITSVQKISLGEQDKQLGGVAMMMGKAAVPYGGGRMASLFSHKKYDSLTIEYVDGNGGFHAAIFRMNKGAAQAFKDDLIAHGADTGILNETAPVQNTSQESPQEAQQWSVQVDRADPGATTLDSCFSGAIYENLLKELSKSKQFKDVFRSGDRNAAAASGVLVLKTLVKKYNAGSETRRAVTTVSGATKLNVQIQLLTPDGRVVLQRDVHGNVRFFGDNLRATSKVAHNAAKILAQSSLPRPQASVSQQGTGIIGSDSSRSSVTLEQSAIK